MGKRDENVHVQSIERKGEGTNKQPNNRTMTYIHTHTHIFTRAHMQIKHIQHAAWIRKRVMTI